MQRKHYEKKKLAKDASHLTVGIAVADFNDDITGPMLEGTLETLRAWKVSVRNVIVMHVPGSFELPLACAKLIRKKKVNAVVALGCVLKGKTKHDEYIAHAVAHALQQLMLVHEIPIGFGVITPNTLAQARARSRGKANKGVEAAVAALEMALGVN